MEEIKDWVKYWREQRQLTQTALVKRLGWGGRDKLHRIEVGDRRGVNLEEILELCEALKRPLTDVIELISKKTGKEYRYINPFLIESSSSYITLLDDIFGLKMSSFLAMLADNFNPQYGFNYEIGSLNKQYYSNVHSTVMFLLYASKLLTQQNTMILQEALYCLRDTSLISYCTKIPVDKYAWDVTEGPSVFATSLACYALLLTKDRRLSEIEKSLCWIITQKNDDEIWPVFKKKGKNNFVSTFYSVIALRLWSIRTSHSHLATYSIQTIFDQVIEFIQHSFVRQNNRCVILNASQENYCLSSTIVGLFLLKILHPPGFEEIFEDVRKSINDILLNDENWWSSLLSDEKGDGKIKTMYTYNPAYLTLLLKMGWHVQDEVILKMISWMFEDLKCGFNRKKIRYPWRSSDSFGQPFVYMFAIYSIYNWLKTVIAFSMPAQNKAGR